VTTRRHHAVQQKWTNWTNWTKWTNNQLLLSPDRPVRPVSPVRPFAKSLPVIDSKTAWGNTHWLDAVYDLSIHFLTKLLSF
jgi:hypothetical protein